jgi:hypothetical protein
MNTQIRHIAIAGSAISALVACGIATEVSPTFKQHATTVGIVLLALISLSGLLAGPILRILNTRPETTGPEHPPGARTTPARATHIRSVL